MSIINIGVPGTGSFLVDIILGLVTATSSVAAGVVLFTLILKLITLPFDFISRSSMSFHLLPSAPRLFISSVVVRTFSGKYRRITVPSPSLLSIFNSP